MRKRIDRRVVVDGLVGGRAGDRRRQRQRGEEAVLDAAAVLVKPDDLARVIDAFKNGALCAQGIVDRGVGAVAV